ncbi:MAG: MarR family transcriptional regulator [Rikenellaceae bacterium]
MIENQIIEALSKDGAMRPGDIATKVGAEKADVDKAIKSLVKQEKVYSPKRCFYDVKK